jgi:hypothetical protein
MVTWANFFCSCFSCAAFFSSRFFSGASVGLSGRALHGAAFLHARCMALFFRCAARCLFSWARERHLLFSVFPLLVSLLKHQELHYFKHQELYYLNTRSFVHLAWNIMSTSFDLNLDPPGSKCSLKLYSYKYVDIILLLLVLLSLFCFQ